MSLDLSHGFFAEVQYDARTVQRVFAANFLSRAGLVRLQLPDRDLAMWFDQPIVALVKDGDPAPRVEVTLRLFARLSDRSDEARVFLTARGPIKDRKVLVGAETRACPSVDFTAATADIAQTFTSSSAYDPFVLPAVRRVLREAPFAVGPTSDDVGKRFYRTYFDFPDRPEGLLVMFVAVLGEPPTPPRVSEELVGSDVMLLVPDDLVNPAITQGVAQAGLGTLPAPLSAEVTIDSLQVTLERGHIRIAGSGRKFTDILGTPVGVGFRFTAFVQLLINPDGTTDIHVIRTQQEIDDPAAEVVDFLAAGVLTRVLDRVLPQAVAGLSLGAVTGLDFLSDEAPAPDDSAPASPRSLTSVFANGMGIGFDVNISVPPEIQPPYFRGHLASRQFHVAGCRFGDLISAANLRKFPSTTAALTVGYDGCSVCQTDFHVPEFGTIAVDVSHPPGIEPDKPVTLRATYAGDLVRFNVPLSPEPEQDTSTEAVDLDSGPTHFLLVDPVAPTDWIVSLTCGSWSVQETIRVAKRVKAENGEVTGERTQLIATVGEPGLVPATA